MRGETPLQLLLSKFWEILVGCILNCMTYQMSIFILMTICTLSWLIFAAKTSNHSLLKYTVYYCISLIMNDFWGFPFSLPCKLSDMLHRTDKLGAAIEQSAGKRIGQVLFCNLCKKDFNYDKGGLNHVNQHVLSSKHKKAWQGLQPDPYLQTTFKTTGGNIQLSKRLNISIMEDKILWLFKVAEED